MAAHGGTCPSPRVLERLLSEELAGWERNSVEMHVEACAECQTLLESMVSSTNRPARAAAEQRPEADPEPSEEFLSRLRELSPPSSRAGAGVPAAPAAATGDAAWRDGDRLGQYEILGRLGKGGMGAVFKARHLELGKVVALKMLRSERADEVMLARFKNEIRAIGRLDHPNIVVAHDAGESGGTHFLVMEYVDGMDLDRLVERTGPLTSADACEVIRQAAVGLQHAHERGLVHRDVKPSNLMLARDGRVRVLDLGLARSFGESVADTLTSHGMVLGTADYLAPEQWQHPHDADTRADVYSLGCSLYHLLAGVAPFAGTSYWTVLGKMEAHLRVPPPIHQHCPELPSGLAAVLGRMLAKVPADRFGSPAEVAEALQPFTVGCDLVRLVARADQAKGSQQQPEVGRKRAVKPRRRMSPVRALAVAVFVLGLLAVTAEIVAPRLWRARGPGAIGEPRGQTPELHVAAPLAIEEFRVNQFRGKQAKPLGDLRDQADEIRVNDSVRVFARLSAPAYCYLIAFNPDGSEQLCHPAWEGDHPREARAARPEPVSEVRFFPDDKGVFGLDATGLQVFVLVASTRPLPPYAEWRSRAGAVPWKTASHGGGWRWLFDGRQFTRLPAERGKRSEREAEPRVLSGLCAYFRNRPEFEAVQAIAFPVVSAEPISRLDARRSEGGGGSDRRPAPLRAPLLLGGLYPDR